MEVEARLEGGDALAPLVLQLREFGAQGDDEELEELLLEGHLDVQHALNAFFDRRAGRQRQDRSSMGAPVERSATVAAAEAEEWEGSACAGSPPSWLPHGGRSGRQARRQAGAAAAKASTEQAKEPAGPRPGAARAKPARRQDVAARKKGRSQVLPMGDGPLPTGVRWATAGFTDSAWEVDVPGMVQRDTETGDARPVRRYKPGVWRFAGGRPNSWAPFPSEVSQELERIFLALTQKPPSDEGKAAADVADPARSPIGLQLAALESQWADHDMTAADARAALDEVLDTAGRGAEAARIVTWLSERQGLRCTASDARRAGLLLGSMALLQAVFNSNPTMELVGMEVFDQKYPSLKLNVGGRKDGVRCLLARGMVLGTHAPASKLLRKVEADSLPLWEARCLEAVSRACPTMPDHALTLLGTFLRDCTQ